MTSEHSQSRIRGLVERSLNVNRITGGPDEFRPEYVKLISRAEQSILQGTSLHPEFYNNDEVKKTIEKAASQVNVFRLLVDPAVDVQSREQELSWLFELPIDIAKATTDIKHTAIIDERHLRYEEPHSPNEQPIQNGIIYNAPDIIVRQEMNLFNHAWEDAEGLQ